ncbi:unnamed protein product [Mytilus coruscus]|uniref:CARD domain-containing protein n=1 Tax=Mytilus coruscus TaxID=42192 RepID=A0A6J8CYP8_MYTCO|nr:unnamed protein product [Mytilus coruscus]
MISSKREDSPQIEFDRSIHLAYRFKEEVVQPAILYRFIATFISMWKLRVSAKSSRLMIFTDSADVTTDNVHNMRIDIQGNRFIVSLSHKESKISIVPTIASTAQECLTHAITNISNFYFSVSDNSDCTRDLPFTIQIGLDMAWLDSNPRDRHLGRSAAEMTMEEIRKVYMHLKEKKPARSWEIINESINKESFNIKIKALHDWKKNTLYASFKQLQQSMKKEDIDIHILCQISNEVQKDFDQPKEKLLIRPSGSNIQQLPHHIGNQTYQLEIELGLYVVEMQQIERNHVTNLRCQTEEVLNKWRRLLEATYEVLVKALHRLELSSVLPYITYEVGLEEHMEVGLEKRDEVGLEEQVEVGLVKRDEIGIKEHVEVGLEEKTEVGLEKQVEVKLEEQVKKRFKQDIQINQILDYMMTHLVISSDDRLRIEQHGGQDDQNKALLEVVNKRRESTYTVFVDALRTSGYTDLANELKCDSQEGGSSEALEQPQNKELLQMNWKERILKRQQIIPEMET